jgi:hypothetical protein
MMHLVEAARSLITVNELLLRCIIGDGDRLSF